MFMMPIPPTSNDMAAMAQHGVEYLLGAFRLAQQFEGTVISKSPFVVDDRCVPPPVRFLHITDIAHLHNTRAVPRALLQR